MDDDRCIGSLIDLFDERIRDVARQGQRSTRRLHVCVAIKEIESWYLADADAINAVIAGCAWQSPNDTERVAKGRLRSIGDAAQRSMRSRLQRTLRPNSAPRERAGIRHHSNIFGAFWSKGFAALDDEKAKT
jgi:hypothetical protein